jgi:adenine-specific DNA-methyltransferase
MKNKHGQYFTTSIFLQEHIYKLIKNNPTTILEPCVGLGHLVNYTKQKIKANFDCFELDRTLYTDKKHVPLIDETDVIFCDFLTHTIDKKYSTIIGNPPYIKNKTTNTYILFIQKCVSLLNKGGELIFIVPSDVFKLTSSIPILKEIFSCGFISDIIHPHRENLFAGANIDVIIFKYIRDDKPHKSGHLIINNKRKTYYFNDVLFLFDCTIRNLKNKVHLEDLFNIYVGIVSGSETIFKHSNGNIDILTDFNHYQRYIMVDSYPTNNKFINDHLLTHKNTLIKRKIRKFNENNWFEWGALRNIRTIEDNRNKNCIYIKCITRKHPIASVGKVDLFNSSMLCMIPKTNVIDLDNIVSFLNSNNFKSNFIYSKRFRITHKQLSKCLYIP